MNFKTNNWKYSMLILGLLLALANTAWTQQIKWSENYEMSSIFNENKIIQASTDGFYVLQNYKDANYYYQKTIGFYDLNFNKREGTEPLEFWLDSTKGKYQFAVPTETSPILFYTAKSDKEQIEGLFARNLDSSTLSLDLGNKVKRISTRTYNSKLNPQDDYRYCVSPDRSKWLFYNRIPYSKKEKGSIGTVLVDFSEDKGWLGLATSPQDIELNQAADILTSSDVVDAVVDNNGRSYLLCKLYKSKNKKEERKIGTRYIYTLIQRDKGKVSVLDTLKVLTAKDSAMIVSAKLSVNKVTGAITCLGTYKLPRKKAGLFSLNLTQGFSGAPIILDYPNEILAQEAQMPRKLKKKKHLSLKNYKVKSIFEQADGTQIIVAEQHYINVYWDKSEGRQELHELNNILLAKIVDDTITWAKVLPKRQKAGGEGYTNVPEKLYSFFAFQQEDTLHVLYNELTENLNIVDEYKLKAGYYNKPKDCQLVHCTVALSSGALLNKASVLGLEEAGVAVYPQATKVLEDGSLLLFGGKPEYKPKEPSYIRFGHWVLD